MRPWARWLVVAAVASGSAGCVTADFKSPVGDFAKGMAQADATVGGYFTGMNDFQRRLYLESALYDPAVVVGVTDAQGRPTGLAPYFSARSIKARTDALALLSQYGQRLTDLAGSDAPARFSSGAQALGTNLSSLDKTFQSLAGSSDPTADAYVQPVAAVIGVVGRFYLETRRNAALAAAVNEAAPSVNAILDQLERDLDTVTPLEVTGLQQSLSDKVLDYNTRKGAMSLEQRKAALDQIDAAASSYQTFVASKPSGAISAVRHAHAALVTYANSPHTPKDFAELSAALDSFNAQVAVVAAALKPKS